MSSSNSSDATIPICILFTALSGLTVCLRLFTRFFLSRSAGAEDYLIIFAWVFSTGFTALTAQEEKYGMGQHIWTLTDEMKVGSLKLLWASIISYNLSLSFSKISILLQYLRVFTLPSFRWVCLAVLGCLCIFSVWTFFGSVFLCTPAPRFWDHSIGGTCLNQLAVWFTNAGIHILLDIIIIILPMPVLKGLNLAKRQRRALMGVFALGGLVVIISILRLQSLIAISNSTDPTYDNPPAATWSSIEANVSIICACLPILRPLISRFFPSIFSSYQVTGDSGGPRGFRTGGQSTRMSRFTATAKTARRSVAPNHMGKQDDIFVMTVVDQHVERIDSAEITEIKHEGELPKSKQGSTDTLVKMEEMV